MFLFWTTIGLVISIGVLYQRSYGAVSKTFYALTLVVAALIYLLFALNGLFWTEAVFYWVLIQIAGTILFSLIAFMAYKKVYNPFILLSMGWFSHTLWDLVMHVFETSSFIPSFYPPICIGFDLGFGVYLLYHVFRGLKE